MPRSVHLRIALVAAAVGLMACNGRSSERAASAADLRDDAISPRFAHPPPFDSPSKAAAARRACGNARRARPPQSIGASSFFSTQGRPRRPRLARKQWDGRPHPKRHQRAKVEMLVTT